MARKNKIPDWTPFQRAYSTPESREFHKKKFGEIPEQECWRNSCYQVTVERDVPNGFGVHGVIWLSIKITAGSRYRHDWRDFQRIKNELCGNECDAIEVYPRESNLHDTADQYHLWVFPESMPLPIGFLNRHVSEQHPGHTGSQRRWIKESRPTDLMDEAALMAMDKRVKWAGVNNEEENDS